MTKRELSPSTQALIDQTEALIAEYPDSAVTAIPDDGDYDHRLTMTGLIYSQVCTRLDAQAAAAWLTQVRPPGTSNNRWELVDGEPPVTCEQFPDTHRHVLVAC